MELLFDTTDTLKEYLNTLLESSTVDIQFEKADGTERIMRSTKDPRIIPAPSKALDDLDHAVNEKKTVRQPHPGVIVVFDVEKNDWRSITLSRIKSITTGKFTLGIDLTLDKSSEEFNG